MNTEYGALEISKDSETDTEGMADADWVMDEEEPEDPDELEMSRILEEKAKAENEMLDVRRRIKYVDARILQLKEAYAAMHNSRYLVLQLPEKVVRIIFSYTQTDSRPSGSLSDPRSPVGLLPEVVISHVCRRWRSISLAYPTLWTRFRYDASLASRVPLDRFRAYMQRSEAEPLELWFKFAGINHDVLDCEDHLNLLEEAILHVQRWKYITVISDDESPLLSASDLLELASSPTLEYFAFCTNNRNLRDLDFPKTLESEVFQNGTPKLASVILDNSISQGLFPPLYAVTTLCLECPEVARSGGDGFPWLTFVGLLSQLHLVNLSILGVVLDFLPPSDSIQPIMLNYLQNLRCSKSGLFPLLLPFLHAPLLETLVIKDESLEHIERGLVFPSLRWLSLVENRISLSAAPCLARMTQFATHITIVNKKYNQRPFFSFLASGPEYWPNLQDLTLDLDIGGQLTEVVHYVIPRRYSDLMLRALDDVVSQWQSTLFLGQPVGYAALTQLCRIESRSKIDWSDFISPAWLEHWISDDWCSIE
ncbi:hypothetical protein CPB84DRAFT_1845827 [Gymnopilus junonius]|uniref:F-box domain-containing protein n=1 Tax=Gymnopilus junonius TaxID=109634 RepID=A0A9P5TNH0_GYMJU|nr:hypothetical protein CPB84DRAFT_1845827 [Gymnopilus junonius]